MHGCVVTICLLLAIAQARGEFFVRLNQLGYPPKGSKVAIVLGREALPGEFQVVDDGSGAIVYSGASQPRSGAWGEFTQHAELDFSTVETPGRYRVRMGESESRPFEIGSIYAALPDQLLEFMRQQRCGYNPWIDKVCHSFDGRTEFGPLPAGTYVDATGGWHDAGDQLKYLLTSSNATAQMLLAFLLTAEVDGAPHEMFADRFNHLGQPGGNGIADVLDEARWGLDWMLKLHPTPDTLYHQVADDRDHAGFRLPHEETVDYGWGPGGARVVYAADAQPQGLQEYKSESTGMANLAGRYAAAMALGYQIWKDDPRERPYAERLLRAGREVYALGKQHEGVQQGNSYKAPYRYEESTWADDMEWGAAELFRATGERAFLDDALRYAQLANTEAWMGREQTKHYQFYPFMNIGHYRLHGIADPESRLQLAGYYRDGIERCVEASAENPYRIGVPFIWCSNNLTVALATQCLLYERMTGDATFRPLAAAHTDWLLGRNPWGYSMFTEIPHGGAFASDVHLFGIKLLKRPVRGGLVDGPVYRRIFKSLRGVTITEPDPLAVFQDDRAVYHDDFQDYSTNEPTMDGTASAILLWALWGE